MTHSYLLRRKIISVFGDLRRSPDTTYNIVTILLDLSYNYGLGVNDNGNVQGIANNKNTARSQSFQYDGLNRLTQAASGSAWGVALTYDPWGNLYQTNPVSGTGTNAMSVNQAMNGQNQFTLLGYAYDAAGNVLTDGIDYGCGGNAYAWNAEEQMSCAAGSTYTYDGDGSRVAKTGGGATSTLYWDGLAESDLSGNVTSEYIFLGGRRIARRDVATGSGYYYFQDMLGSSNVVASSLGTLVNESDFYPFGGELPVTQNLANQKYKFTGKERDAETGLDDFGARYYNSLAGRFQSPDWANKAEPAPYAKLDNPQSLNLYAYVVDNPESAPDLDGHNPSNDNALNDPSAPPPPSTTTPQTQTGDQAQQQEKLAQQQGTQQKGSVGDRIALGAEAVANTVVGIPKAAAGAAALVVGTAGTETGVGLGVAAGGAYELTQASGQLESAGLQANAAITGNTTGVDEKTDRISASTSIAGVIGTALNHGDYHAGSKYAAAEGVFSGALAGDLVKGVTHIIDTVLNLKDLVTQ